MAPKGSKVEVGVDGKVQIFKPTEAELNKDREYGENTVGTSKSDELILPLNQEVFWQKDFYNMLWDHNLKENLMLLVQLMIIYPVSLNQPDPTNTKYETIGYLTFRLNHEDGTIRFGTYEQNTYRPPIQMHKMDDSQMMPSRIKFTIA